MLGRSHTIVAGAAFLTVGQAALAAAGEKPPTPGQLVAGTVVAGGAGLLADLDLPTSTVSQSLGPVTRLISRAFGSVLGGHRAGSHGFPFVVGFTILVGSLLHRFPGPLLPLGLASFLTALVVRVLTNASSAVCAIFAGSASSLMILSARGQTGWLVDAIVVGLVAHLICDAVTVEGVPPLWPLSKRRIAFPLVGVTGGWREHLVSGLCGLLAVHAYASVVIPRLLGAG